LITLVGLFGFPENKVDALSSCLRQSRSRLMTRLIYLSETCMGVSLDFQGAFGWVSRDEVRFQVQLSERDRRRSEFSACGKPTEYQRLTSSAPNRRSHQVWRILPTRDHFWATWR